MGIVVNLAGNWMEVEPNRVPALLAQGAVLRNPADAAAIPKGGPVKYDSSGRPIMGDYEGITDEGGNLLSPYSLGAADSLYSFASENLAPGVRGSIDALKARTGEGASPWAKVMLEQQALSQQRQRESAENEGANAAASAWGQLAMRGGLSGGERERIGYSAQGDIANRVADINRAGAAERLGITGQDESTKLRLLESMPGLESSYSEMLGRTKEADIARDYERQKFNIGNAAMDKAAKNKYKLGAYGSAMNEFGAAKTAEAQEDSGK